MKIGTYLVKGPGKAEERLKLTRDLGFDFVCLGRSALDGKNATPKLCEKYGIPFDNIHLSCTNATLIWFPGEDGEAITDRYCSEIAAAAELGIHTGIVHVTWRRKPLPPADPQVGLARYVRIMETAVKYDFRIAVENSAYEKQLFDVLDNFGAPFYHCFDCGHRNCFTPGIDYLAKYGSRLIATHIHDNDGHNDLHILPFDGTIDFAALAPAYAATELASQRICSEFVGPSTQDYPGMSAEEIGKVIGRMAIDPADVKITDGSAAFYQDVPYEELLGRLYERMKRLGDMIESVKN